MKKISTLFLLVAFSATFAQSTDYNTKKGVVAQGYDVVSYFEGTPTEGSSEYKTTYDEVEFKFSSKEHLEAFKEDPVKYIPQYGGYCAYAIASGEKVRINPETYEIRDDKLYLFYNAGKTNTLTLWIKEGAEQLKTQADKNWQKIKFDN